MKIEFVQAPKGRDFKVGDVVDFKGQVEEDYAQKYIQRGWARPVDDAAADTATTAAAQVTAVVPADTQAADDVAAKAAAIGKARRGNRPGEA